MFSYIYMENICPDWGVGQVLQYISTGETVLVLKKHFDDITPYYTIRMSDGREKQTIAENMQIFCRINSAFF